MSNAVSFHSRGLKIAALFFGPQTTSLTKRSAAIVISHPGGGTKEQTASLYAQRLAEKGFVTLAFDAAYQGESEGTPRGLEDPNQRSEDIKSAVSYLASRDDVDPEKIAALGICASGAFVPFAAQTDLRIKAVATISAFDMGDVTRTGLDGQLAHAELRKTIAKANSLRTAEANGAEPTYTEVVRKGESYDYYCTPRGQHPRSMEKNLVRNSELLSQFEPWRFVKWIAPRPLLMIAGTEAFSKPVSEKAIEQADEPKELFLVDGATHMSLYDQEEHVGPAVKKLVEFFNGSLE